MPQFEDTPWARLRKDIDDFRRRMGEVALQDVGSRATVELAIDLKRLNAQLEDLATAIHKIADNS